MFPSATIAILLAVAAMAFADGFTDTHPGTKGASGDGDVQMTYYLPGVPPLDAPGACGVKNTVDDYIVAVAHGYFDSFGAANPNNNPLCNKNIKVNYQGKSVVATITDRCADCDNQFSVDLTPKGIKEILGDAYESIGRVHGVTWDFTDEPVGPASSGAAAPAPSPANNDSKPSPTETANDPAPTLEQSPEPSPSPEPQPTEEPSPSPSPSPEPQSTEAPSPSPSPSPDASTTAEESSAPSPTPSESSSSNSGTFDDGMYHPSDKYDDGKYHPSSQLDDGKYHGGRRSVIAKRRLPKEH